MRLSLQNESTSVISLLDGFDDYYNKEVWEEEFKTKTLILEVLILTFRQSTLGPPSQ
jgi:hypothetical protein